MKINYEKPQLVIEEIKVEDVVLVSTINEDHNMGNFPYDDEF